MNYIGESMDYYRIGQRIRKYRKAQKLSQEQLAERIGISVTHMSHIETGNTKLSLQVFYDISNALNVCADDLLSDTLTNSKKHRKEILDIIDSCTPQQTRIITDMIKCMKSTLDKYK